MVTKTTEKILGRESEIRRLFGRTYRLGNYQREYAWQRQHIVELVDDLERAFLSEWDASHDRYQYQYYRPYFLGPFVSYPSDGHSELVDGQQRFTTIHLLLIHLANLLMEQGEEDLANEITRMVVVYRAGENRYVLDIDERGPCLDAIRKGEQYDVTDASISVRNLWQRSVDISEIFPESLRDERLPLFAEWLLDRVFLVEITAANRTDAWEIYETMNDRGVRLTPLDLLKSYLFSKIGSEHQEAINEEWRAAVEKLDEFGRHIPAEFFRTLLLGRYAEINADEIDQIRQGFHEWVRNNPTRLGLVLKDHDFREFISKVVVRTAKQYAILRQAARCRIDGLDEVYFNARNGIDAQFQLILAAARPDDSDRDFRQRSRLISAYLDYVFITRMVNNGSIQPRDLQDEVFRLIPVVRGANTIGELRSLLGREAAEIQDTFEGGVTNLSLHNNRAQLRYLLARLTAFVESESGRKDEAARYLEEPWEIEHIWANKYQLHVQSGVANEQIFSQVRNQVGALLLLPKSDNASFGADRYLDKLEHYRRMNYLAASLHPDTYERNPMFHAFLNKYDLKSLFIPYPAGFDKNAIESRAILYVRLCEVLWSLNRMGFVRDVTSAPGIVHPKPARPPRTRIHYGVQLRDLIGAGMLSTGARIFAERKRSGEKYVATITDDGSVLLESGERFKSLSAAGSAVQGIAACAGWNFWHVLIDDEYEPLAQVRKRAIERGVLED